MITAVARKEPADRAIMRTFLKSYLKLLAVEYDEDNLRYPEDCYTTAANAKIDGIYNLQRAEIHIEHTSFDLIACNGKPKRELDEAFRILEKELEKIVVPEGRGVTVRLPMEYAHNIPAIKKITPELSDRVKTYLHNTPREEWNIFPRPPDTIVVDNYSFLIRPDRFKKSKLKLEWAVKELEVLENDGIEPQVRKAYQQKLPKLQCSLADASLPAFGILLITCDQTAAPGFYSSCGVFARCLRDYDTSVSEIWAAFDQSNPLLMWSEVLDNARNNCVYSDDLADRTAAVIERERVELWKKLRTNWISNQIFS